MGRNNLNLSRIWQLQQWTFIPNGKFWAVLLAAGGMSIWLLVGEWQRYTAIQEQLAQYEAGASALQLPKKLPLHRLSSWHSTDMFSPSVALSIGVALSALLRLLTNYLVKRNKVLLLTHEESGSLSVYMGSRYVPFRFGWKFWLGAALALGMVFGGWYRMQASNESVHQALLELEQHRQLEERQQLEAEQAVIDSQQYKEDVIGYFMDHLKQHRPKEGDLHKNYQEAFTVQKQLITSQYLIEQKASRVDQLSSQSLLSMHQEISDLFIELVLKKQSLPEHVLHYFTDTTDLDKLETALMEQAKYHVPASIKLAQSALETAYGRRVIHNNYFGIKNRGSGEAKAVETIEYYSRAELRANRRKVISRELVSRGGKKLYKCRVKDKFQPYKTPWASFRAHSIFLSNNKRYHALFTGGKDYRAWADKIGSTKYGGVGYATSPIYGELLKKIIRRYHLDLLDY